MSRLVRSTSTGPRRAGPLVERGVTAAGFATVATVATVAAVVCTLVCLAPQPAGAVVPATMAVSGIMHGSGGPAVDGKYVFEFSLYAAETGGKAVWTEGLVPVSVAGGRFDTLLGAKEPLTAAVVAGMDEIWLGVSVALEAEQPRVRLHAVAFAVQAATAAAVSCSGCITAENLAPGLLGAVEIGPGSITADKVAFKYAGSQSQGGSADLANDLECTGCVSVAEMNFDADVDLGGNALKAKKVTAESVAGSVVYAGSFEGDGSLLTGIKTVSGGCEVEGEVVKGIEEDGTFLCVPGAGAQALPPDGIDEVSNGLIFNQFTDKATSDGPVQIADKDALGVSDTIVFPDVGLAQKISVHVFVQNCNNVADIEITLLDPNDDEYTLLPQGKGVGGAFDNSFPDPILPSKGDLGTWVGKNPKGKWRLKVVDFVDNPGDTDGQITTWDIQISTLSSKKIAIKGDLIVDGDVSFKKSVTFEGGIAFGKINQQNFQMCADADVNGPCVAKLSSGQAFLEAAQHCAAMKADICTDSQSYVMRRTSSGSTIYNFTLLPNWTNSFADYEGGGWPIVNGGTGDNHSANSKFLVPCCHNITPTAVGEQNVAGIRVLKVHNGQDADWDTAASACLEVMADLCDTGQYRILRNHGAVTGKVWSSDHSDNDSTNYDKGLGGVPDDPNPSDNYGYACCATNRKTPDCPPGATDVDGVCVATIHDAGANWNTAAGACAGMGARLCSIAQTAVLRAAGKVKAAGSWTASYSDNDSGQASIGVGNVGDDHPPSSSYGYACCY